MLIYSRNSFQAATCTYLFAMLLWQIHFNIQLVFLFQWIFNAKFGILYVFFVSAFSVSCFLVNIFVNNILFGMININRNVITSSSFFETLSSNINWIYLNLICQIQSEVSFPVSWLTNWLASLLHYMLKTFLHSLVDNK